MDTPFKPNYETESKTWGLGLKLIFQLVGLPPKELLEHCLFEIEAVVTNNDAANDATVYTQQIAKIVAQMYHKSLLWDLRTTGRALWVAYRHLRGKTVNNSSQLVAKAGGTKTFRLALPLYLSDPRGKSPNDACQNTALLEGKTFELQCASTDVIGTTAGGDQVLTSATIRLVCNFIPANQNPNEADIPSKLMQDYEDWAQQDAFLKVGGAYSHLAIYDETDDAVDTTEYERVRVQLGGFDVVDRLRGAALIADYNDRCAMGGAVAAGAADGIAETEQLAVTGSTLFIPVLTPPAGYQGSELPKTGQGQAARVTIDGTATGARFLYRMIMEKTQPEIQEAARMLGITLPGSASYTSATASKTPLRGTPEKVASLQRLLPVKAVGA